jgi:hypothetical protein
MTTEKTDKPLAVDFNTDLFNALAAIPTLKKDASNPHFKNHYLTIEGLIEGVKPILLAHNFVLLQPVTSEGPAVTVTTILRHISGEQLASALTLTVRGEATSQALGSAITYARRYGAGGLLGLATSLDSASDDDGNAASAASATDTAYVVWVAALGTTVSSGYDALLKSVESGTDTHKAKLRKDTSVWKKLKDSAVKTDEKKKLKDAAVKADENAAVKA